MLIAHFSDIHVAPEGKLALHDVDTATALSHCVQHINNLVPQPNLIVITGDLTSEGSPEEYAVLRSNLALLDQPYFFVPGNHDNRANLRAAFSDIRYLQNSGEFIQYTVDEYPVRLVALDTVSPGDHFGILCERRLDWLDRTLAAQTQKPTLLFMHHPPFSSGSAHMDTMKLMNSEQLAGVLRKYDNITMILCGHLHRPVQTIWANIHTLAASSIAKQFSLELSSEETSVLNQEPKSMYLHLLTSDGFVTHTSLISDPEGQLTQS